MLSVLNQTNQALVVVLLDFDGYDSYVKEKLQSDVLWRCYTMVILVLTGEIHQ